MNNRSNLIIVVAIGFLLGLGARFALHDPSRERVERAVFIFKEICIEPYFSNRVAHPKNYGLETYPDAISENRWADNASMTFLLLDDERNCRLSAPPEFSFSADQAKFLMSELDKIVENRFPELSFDKGMEGTATFARGWFEGRIASANRWGIYFWASSVGEERLHTIMTFKKPRPE